jgi:hypothetical protein
MKKWSSMRFERLENRNNVQSPGKSTNVYHAVTKKFVTAFFFGVHLKYTLNHIWNNLSFKKKCLLINKRLLWYN